MKEKIKISNLDCANCALELKEIIEKIDGVTFVNVDYINQYVYVEYLNDNDISIIKNTINNFEEVKIVEEETNDNHLYEIVKIVISSVSLIISLLMIHLLSISYGDYNLLSTELWYQYILLIVLTIVSYFFSGYEIFLKVIKNISKGSIFDENFLMLLGSIGAIFIGEVEEGIMILILYNVGELLQNIAVKSSRKSITSLMDLKVDTVTKVEGLLQMNVDVEELKVGDVILIKKGEKVPVDVQICEGESSFDTKTITGESLLKVLNEGEVAFAGYINLGKLIKAKVIRKYQDSAVKKILDMVENSSMNKSEKEKFITRFARYYTPIVCVISLIVGVIIPIVVTAFNGWNFSFEIFQTWLYRAITILVISCPCALVISVPLAYFNSVGTASKKGILIKGTTFLDEVNAATLLGLDKTGTITKGSFSIVNVITNDDNALSIASSLEVNSTHPISNAFNKEGNIYEVNDFEEISSYGVKGIIDDNLYLLGNDKLLEKYNILYEKHISVSVVLYLVKENKVIAIFEIDDTLKDNINETLLSLKENGINKSIILSGDKQNRLDHIKNSVNINLAIGELLPHEKLLKIKELKNDGKLIFVGDGINDSPSLIEADVGISMGQLGSDIAIESSDIVLVNDKIEDLVTLKKIAKNNNDIVIQNIIFSIVCKVLFIVLGAMSIIPLSLAVFADVGVMLLCVLNSLRINLVK